MPVLGLDRHIESSPGLAGGKPRIAGHRITVQDIAMMHHEMAKSVDEICAEYGLGLAEVHAALAYYFDHRAEVDKCIKESRDLVVKLRNTTPSQVKERLQGQPRG